MDSYTSPKIHAKAPTCRRLRIYALDPSLQTSLETAVINVATVRLRWENLRKGPVGEYIEVVDYDPASRLFYEPVDLEARNLLAQDGLAPSDGNPQFHQQMVYAVAMMTIKNFEWALGRKALWAPREAGGKGKPKYVPRLRIYPHALREANAFYSPRLKALLFGYFPADPSQPGTHLPGGMVFTCLSHDIIAHETTHALLDSMHPLFIESTNKDVHAFHEAFADIVALFQHFSMSEILAHQIARTHGNMTTPNLLAELASQVGRATGTRGALRDAIGKFDEKTGAWKRHVPDASEYERIVEPHARGSLLVAAIFDAFIAIYEKRSQDLFRLSSGGTGILPEGSLHPDLINRLANEAAKTAQHFLTMCIRALDYCPSCDITFGEYLRALITADRDMVPYDEFGYRIALIEAFRRRGIYPRDIRTLSEESLVWVPPSEEWFFKDILPPKDKLQRHMAAWDFTSDREDIHGHMTKQIRYFERYLQRKLTSENSNRIKKAACESLGIDLHVRCKDRKYGELKVDTLRTARRIGPDGRSLVQLIVSISQLRPIFFTSDQPCPKTWSRAEERNADAWFRGGCTMIIDIETASVRYLIRKPFFSNNRRKRQVDFQKETLARSLRATYFGKEVDADEPFAMLHHSNEEEYHYE